MVNRRSLNVESNRLTQNKIKDHNLRFLRKLQSLKSTYPTDEYIQQHKERGHIVERISRYPLVLDQNCDQSVSSELPQIPEKQAFLTTRLDSKEYMRAVRAFEGSQKLIPSEDILALSRFSST